MDFKKLIRALQFSPQENTSSVLQKEYADHDGYTIEIDLAKEQFHFGNKIKSASKTTHLLRTLKKELIKSGFTIN